MASPVDTTVKWARSSMPGAPALTRAAGSLIALLDALLVNGWGQQTATSVVVSGGVATATFPSDHAAARHAVVLVAGVTGSLAGLNGEQKVVAVEPNKIKWATTAANGTATGSITIKMAGAGWTKPFSGTNLAAYKSASPAAHGQFLRVNDTTANYARAVGYELMTAISAGSGLFPTAAQVNGGYYWGKSDEASAATPVPYTFASDGRTFYLFPQACATTSGTTVISFSPIMFGDLVPEGPAGDPFATAIAGSPDSLWGSWGPANVFNYAAYDAAIALPRAFSGTGTAVRSLSYCELNLDNAGGSALHALPNPITGAIPMGRVLIKDPANAFPRAAFPGAYYCPAIGSERFVLHGDMLELSSGKTMLSGLACTAVNAGTNAFGVFLDISGPWR